MEKIEAIIKPFELEEVKDALMEVGIEGMTVTEVMEFGCLKRPLEIYRGSEYTMEFQPKIKLEIVVTNGHAAAAVAAVVQHARTEKNKHEQIFVAAIEQAVEIGTEETKEGEPVKRTNPIASNHQ